MKTLLLLLSTATLLCAAGPPNVLFIFSDDQSAVQRTVIHDGWKLILYPKAKVVKLYHLSEDPQETKDLAADPAMADRKKALYVKFRELQQRYNDKLDLDGMFTPPLAGE